MNIPYSAGLGLEAEALASGDLPALRAASHRHHAWQSAMEQAQLAGWFKPALETGHAQDQAGEQPALPQPAVREPSRMHPPMDGARLRTEASVQRSASSLAVAQALHAAGGLARMQAQAGAAAGLATPGSDAAEATAPGATGGLGGSDPAVQRMTARLAAQVWRHVEASLSEDPPRALGMAVPAGPGARPGNVLQAESAAQAPQMHAVPAAQVPKTAPSPLMFDTAAPVRQGDAAGQPEQAAAEPRGASRLAPTALAGSAQHDEAATAMRVHVDWSEQGARIWLGVNHERLVSLPGLARQLDQWLQASGVKLASLVCNGRTIPTRFSERSSG